MSSIEPLRERSRRPRRRALLGAALLALVVGGAGCEPSTTPATRTVTADRDTFSVSAQPTATRGEDAVLRVMGSDTKTKIAYVSFPVGGSGAVDATLLIVPNRSGFTVDVHEVAPFTEATTYATRPTLGASIGTLDTTVGGERQAIAVRGADVVGGRVDLALTTSGPWELEVVSSEGALASGTPSTAPTLVLDQPSPPPTTTAAPPAGWRLSWADEFSGTRVDPSRWNVYDEGTAWGSVESPKTSTCPKASNVSVSGGVLVLRTQRAGGACAGGQPHTGAGLNTWGTFEQAQGRIETRARWTAAGNYLWGGVWTHGNGGPGYDKTKASEIDLFEYIGKTSEPNISRFKPAIHFNYTCTPKCMQNVAYTGFDVTAWHTYAVEWEPAVPGDPSSTQIRFFLDGRQIAQFDRAGAWAVNRDGTRVLVEAGAWENPNAPFPYPFGPDRAHKIVLSAWVGAPGVDAATVARGYAPPGGHADLQVDWVRAYRRPS